MWKECGKNHKDKSVGCNALAVRQSPACKDVNIEAKESILLGAITEQCLVKTKWEGLVSALECINF
jgi:hypothetical protein